MTFVKPIDIDELSDREITNQLIGLVRGLSKVANHFRDVSVDQNREFLSKLLEFLDEADDSNSFGSEGWRYFLE